MKPNFNITFGDYTVLRFPSGELQITLINKMSSYLVDNCVTIRGSVTSSDHIIELLQLVEAIKHSMPTVRIKLIMPYCAFSRQDRRCNDGESFSLKVFTNLINSCNFQSVITYDNHSDVSTALIDNCYNKSVTTILDNYSVDLDLLSPTNALSAKYDYFVSPDAGANKKVQSCSQRFGVPMIRADKQRDLATGKILATNVFVDPGQLSNVSDIIKVNTLPTAINEGGESTIRYGRKYLYQNSFYIPEAGTGKDVGKTIWQPYSATTKELSSINGKTVLIIDDICQGGRTFVELAKALKYEEPNVEIHLFVTHGFFSNGLHDLIQAGITKFITTDSVVDQSHPAMKDYIAAGTLEIIEL